jgi:hypothetical protein
MRAVVLGGGTCCTGRQGVALLPVTFCRSGPERGDHHFGSPALSYDCSSLPRSSARRMGAHCFKLEMRSRGLRCTQFYSIHLFFGAVEVAPPISPLWRIKTAYLCAPSLTPPSTSWQLPEWVASHPRPHAFQILGPHGRRIDAPTQQEEYQPHSNGRRRLLMPVSAFFIHQIASIRSGILPFHCLFHCEPELLHSRRLASRVVLSHTS